MKKATKRTKSQSSAKRAAAKAKIKKTAKTRKSEKSKKEDLCLEGRSETHARGKEGSRRGRLDCGGHRSERTRS